MRSGGAGQRRGTERTDMGLFLQTVGGRFDCSEESDTKSLLPSGKAQAVSESCSSQMLWRAAVATSVVQWQKFEADMSPEV